MLLVSAASAVFVAIPTIRALYAHPLALLLLQILCNDLTPLPVDDARLSECPPLVARVFKQRLAAKQWCMQLTRCRAVCETGRREAWQHLVSLIILQYTSTCSRVRQSADLCSRQRLTGGVRTGNIGEIVSLLTSMTLR